MKPIHAVACCALIVLLWGCAGLQETKVEPPLSTPSTEADAETVMQNLERVNRDLISFKGIGKIKIWQHDSLQSTRIVWAGHRLHKLRIEILGIAGQPLSAFAFDGSHFYLALHAENRFFQKQTRRANLKRLITIPLTVPDTLAILTGRVPLWENASTSLVKQPQRESYLFTLQKKHGFRNQIAKIYLHNDLRTVYQYELYENHNELSYRVQFLERKQYGAYQLPALLQISDDQQNRIQIAADRIWPDADISSETFVLKPPK